jgi:hypothetical protein
MQVLVFFGFLAEIFAGDILCNLNLSDLYLNIGIYVTGSCISALFLFLTANAFTAFTTGHQGTNACLIAGLRAV